MQSIIPRHPQVTMAVVSEVDRQLRGRLREFRISPDGGARRPSTALVAYRQAAICVRRLSIVGLVLKIVAWSVNYRLCPRTAIIRPHIGYDATQILSPVPGNYIDRLLHSFIHAGGAFDR